MKKIFVNWGFLLASDVVQQLSGFAVLILLARKLSPAGYGEFNVIISLAMIFSVISNVGMSQVLIREITLTPKDGRSIVAKVAPARILSFSLAVFALLTYHYSFGSGVSSQLLFFVVAIIFNLSLWDISESVAFGNKVTKYSSILNISFSICWLLAILLFPESFFNLTAVLFAFCLLNFLKSLRYVWLATKVFLKRPEDGLTDSCVTGKEILYMSLPYLWLMGICTLSNQLPVQLLNINADPSQVGFYSVGNKLMIPIVVAISTAFKAIFPFMTEVYKKNQEKFGQYIKEGFGFIITFGTVIAVALSLTSKYWIVFVFGDEYAPAVVVFGFLIWFGVVSIMDSLLSLALSSSYRQKTLAVLATIDFVIILPMFYFGSFYGAYGLSLMKLIAGLLILLYHWVVFVKALHIKISTVDLLGLYGFLLMSMASCVLLESTLMTTLSSAFVVILFIAFPNSPVRKTILSSYGLMSLQFREYKGAR